MSAWVSSFIAPRQKAPEGEDISFICYSIIPWSGVWQRPQHFATRLARNHKVLYIDPVGLQHIIADKPLPELESINPNLTIFRPQVLPGGKTKPLVIAINDRYIAYHLKKLIHRLELTNPVFVTNTPLGNQLADSYTWTAVVYDVIDDFIAASWAPKDATFREEALFQKADTVFTGTHSLYEKKLPRHPQVEFIPCGVEVDHFLKANNSDTKLPADAADLPKPIFGYFGALNERIDSDLLVQLACAFPHGTVLLIGPIFADFGLSDFQDEWASVLPNPQAPGFKLKPNPSNIKILGIRSYDQLPGYLKAFDVCLLPYVINQVTKDIHPVKILEYLAAGRPVISTPLPDVEKFYSKAVYIADSSESFAEKARLALKENTPEKQQQRTEFARPKTWENMTLRMKQKILELPCFKK